MHRVTMQWILTIFALAMIGQSPSAVQLAPKLPKPVILSVVQDSQNHLVISGQNLGHAPPLVRLGGRLVEVESFATNQVVVDLPAGIQPGTYLLTVTSSNASAANMAIFAGR